MYPLVFEPYLRTQVWGGRRLGECLGKRLPPGWTFGESWEISAHPHHVSRVAEGPYSGTSFTQLLAHRPQEIYGEMERRRGRFPLLVKLLDCHELLSVQVHPTDAIASRLREGELGKTEAWVVLGAEPTARVYAGLIRGTTRSILERHLETGTVEQCLHSFTPHPGDCLFLPAGTVHAVGGGVLMAEVQQSSDATFRLFDWNRPGPDGKPRQLHIREALDSINWDAGPVYPVRGEVLPGTPAEMRGERLVQCPYFCLDRFHLQGSAPLPAGRLSLWISVEGSSELSTSDGRYRRLFHKGESVLVPAAAPPLIWQSLRPDRGTVLLAATLP